MKPGWRPWLVWGLSALFFCYIFFQRVAPSVMIDPLMRDLGVGAAVLGNLSAFYFYAYAGLQIPVGIMHDRWGPRRVLTGAALFTAAGSALFAMADSVLAVYLGRLVIGAGAAFSFVGSLKLAGSWFPLRRFALVSGLTMMLGMLGGVFGQAPLAMLVETSGWRPALGGAAVAGVVLAAAIWFVVRDRPTEMAPLGAVSRGLDSGAAKPKAPGVFAALRTVLSRPQNWILALIGGAMSAPMLAFAGLWGVAWLMQTQDLTRAEAAATTSLLLIGWAVGSPTIGAISDAAGRRKPWLIAAALGGLAGLSALIYVPELPLAVLSILFLTTGACLGGMVIAFALARESNPADSSGMALAFVNMAVMGSGALFQPLVGLLLDRHWDGALLDGARVYSAAAYQSALSVLVLFLGAGLVLCFAAREALATTGATS